ncbi:MAG: fibrillarin-like rRNA/tRNA 2'-O-methyltransferase [Methanotrichaceae archaeon]|nr:fibrillarin-like rRNA/tRNA 2'-O-methyltransferase [Methanotrichaceae archaeon]
MPEEVLPGVYLLELDGQKRLATRSDTNISVYGERFVEGYRLWDPNRSKFSALFLKVGPKKWLGKEKILDETSKVLYLGAATGTTVSHISDIVRHGLVYAVEFSPRTMQDLLRLCEIRDNIVPVLADASKPESYCRLVEQVDLIYQDVAQRNQSEIASLNCDMYLQPRGILILMIKARSIDVVASPKEIYSREIEKLNGLEVLITSDLHPYHHDHLAVVARKI